MKNQGLMSREGLAIFEVMEDTLDEITLNNICIDVFNYLNFNHSQPKPWVTKSKDFLDGSKQSLLNALYEIDNHDELPNFIVVYFNKLSDDRSLDGKICNKAHPDITKDETLKLAVKFLKENFDDVYDDYEITFKEPTTIEGYKKEVMSIVNLIEDFGTSDKIPIWIYNLCERIINEDPEWLDL